MKRALSGAVLAALLTQGAVAQEVKFFKQKVAQLCGLNMNGRGYVGKGVDRASNYIERQFAAAGLQPVGGRWTQQYSFGVNTFPDTVALRINRKTLRPGADFLVDAGSPSVHGRKAKIRTADLGRIQTAADWSEQRKKLADASRVWLLRGTDSFFSRLGMHPAQLAGELPAGTYLLPQKGKMMWTVSTEPPGPAALMYVQDSVLPKRARNLTIDVHSKYIPAYQCENVMGMVKGTAVPDSFIVYTAHYDHLGKMGHGATFPGASDNASGTAMLLYLAQHFAQHPPRYSVLFIAFSGEEAGLLGSQYYVQHPVVPLAQMRFLINVDIMGDATDGVTTVNATEYPEEFALLNRLNNEARLLPRIGARGKAANSDHYPFSEAGVRSFFLYAMGGKGFYHDIFDVPASLSYANIPQVARLLVRFGEALCQ